MGGGGQAGAGVSADGSGAIEMLLQCIAPSLREWIHLHQRMAYPQSSEVRPPVTRRDATRTDVRVGAGGSDARRADVREE